jgi:hypothetical protein
LEKKVEKYKKRNNILGIYKWVTKILKFTDERMGEEKFCLFNSQIKIQIHYW